MISDEALAARTERLHWLARVFEGDPEAVRSDVVAGNIVDPANVFGIETYFQTFSPVRHIHEQHASARFEPGDVEHPDPDRAFVVYRVAGTPALIAHVRFEEEAPWRMRYWGAYAPLAPGVTVRPYGPEDAAACAELELRTPMKFESGDSWIIDRGARFHDYLQLTDAFDAAVAVDASERVVGFFSTALRPIRMRGADAWTAYQHHVRVDPELRGANLSMALGTWVDSRRAFESWSPQMVYSMIDPTNVQMRNAGFPPVPGAAVARISIPLTDAPATPTPRIPPDPMRICARINSTHERRTLFRPYSTEFLADRCSRIADYTLDQFLCSEQAVLGIWGVNERNHLITNGEPRELRLAFALDYGFETAADLEHLVRAAAPELAATGTTHLCFLCDVRAPEYPLLESLAADVQRFEIHTLPWLFELFTDDIVYWDGVYL